MYLYNQLNITWDEKAFPQGNLIVGKIGSQLNLDELFLHPDLIEIKLNYMDENIFRKYKVQFSEFINNINFDIQIEFIKIICMELFTPHMVTHNLFVRDALHVHFIIVNNLINSNIHSYKMDTFMKEIEKPKIYSNLQMDSEKILLELFPYQKSTLEWMQLMELECNNIYISNDRIIQLDNQLEYNSIKNTFVTKEEKGKMLYSIKGGIIANEVGTGKTVIIIANCLMQPQFSNLILVPNHLKKHWTNEFVKHTGQQYYNYNNITLLTFEEFTNCEYNIDGIFDRIIVDELHETYLTNIIDKISTLKNVKYYWGVTGTPIVCPHSLYYIIQFLLGKSRKELYNSYISHSEYIQQAMKQFFHRILKKDINHLLNLQPIQIYDKILKFSEVEQQIYDSEANNTLYPDINFLRKICVDILSTIEIENNKSISIKQLKGEVLKYFKNKLEIESSKLEILQQQILNIESEIKNTTNEKIKLELEFNLAHYTQLYSEQNMICTSRKEVLERYMMTFEKIENIINNDDNDDDNDDNDDNDNDSCVICLCPHSNPILYLRQCGHYFCKSCFDLLEQRNKYCLKCPVCRIDISPKDKITVSDQIKQQISTKYKEVINIVTNIRDSQESVVIFTQFENILENLKKHLTTFNIECGNLEVVINGISPHVLLLSSESNASGLDLTSYSNVIILEPVVNYIYGREIEKQIIGRVHRINQTKQVKVFRLIISNTIEEQIYSI